MGVGECGSWREESVGVGERGEFMRRAGVGIHHQLKVLICSVEEGAYPRECLRSIGEYKGVLGSIVVKEKEKEKENREEEENALLPAVSV